MNKYMGLLEKISFTFNNRITFRERGEDTFQIIAPFFHEDGDMYDLFLEIDKDTGFYKICDHGLTLMRLSYIFDIDTPKKTEIFYQILEDNKIENDNGNLFITTSDEYIYNAILRFTQVISKITNMQLYRRDVVRSLFYDDLKEFVLKDLLPYFPISEYLPIPEREDLEVDFCLKVSPKMLFLFGVKDNSKARLVTISCLEYMRKNIPFRSIVVHEDFDMLSTKDRRIITNVVDKQFTDLSDFRNNAINFIEREIA